MTAIEERGALWKKTNAAGGRLTRAAWVEHLRAEHKLAERDPRFDLEAILVIGLRRRFIDDADEAAALVA